MNAGAVCRDGGAYCGGGGVLVVSLRVLDVVAVEVDAAEALVVAAAVAAAASVVVVACKIALVVAVVVVANDAARAVATSAVVVASMSTLVVSSVEGGAVLSPLVAALTVVLAAAVVTDSVSNCDVTADAEALRESDVICARVVSVLSTVDTEASAATAVSAVVADVKALAISGNVSDRERESDLERSNHTLLHDYMLPPHSDGQGHALVSVVTAVVESASGTELVAAPSPPTDC